MDEKLDKRKTVKFSGESVELHAIEFGNDCWKKYQKTPLQN